MIELKKLSKEELSRTYGGLILPEDFEHGRSMRYMSKRIATDDRFNNYLRKVCANREKMMYC